VRLLLDKQLLLWALGQPARLTPAVRKQFDRILVAQASVEPMILLTNDAALSGYGSFVAMM